MFPNIVLVTQLPYQFLNERYVLKKCKRSPFIQQGSCFMSYIFRFTCSTLTRLWITATPFEDFVIRIVRYAFARMPANIGRVFFSKAVALPFLRFRMLRHGFVHSPILWRDITLVRSISSHNIPCLEVFVTHLGCRTQRIMASGLYMTILRSPI